MSAPRKTTETPATEPWIGVVVVTYGAADYIAECLESLVATGYPRLKVVVVDNASPDATPEAVRAWATGARPFAHPEDWPIARAALAPKPRSFADMDAKTAIEARFDALAEVTLVRSGANRGFAGGVNLGLRTLLPHAEIDLFWVLNPDCVVEPQTPAAFAAAAARARRFSIMGGRAIYFGEPEIVQADGGRYRPWRGTGGSLNVGRPAAECAPPDPATMDYIPGISMLTSRLFLERCGLMDESWFLYYDEIDWAFRRGDLPLAVAPEARVRHRSGAAIGSKGHDRLAGPLSAYFGARNRLRFVLRWRPWAAPAAYVTSILSAAKTFLPAGAWTQWWATLRGLHGLPPPAAVRARLDPSVWSALERRTAEADFGPAPRLPAPTLAAETAG